MGQTSVEGQEVPGSEKRACWDPGYDRTWKKVKVRVWVLGLWGTQGMWGMLQAKGCYDLLDLAVRSRTVSPWQSNTLSHNIMLRTLTSCHILDIESSIAFLGLHAVCAFWLSVLA